MSVLQVTNLVKHFGEVKAVDGVTFSVEEGEVFGLLGPNGAGKTTVIRMLATLLAPTSGEATINGVNVFSNPNQVRSQIGYGAQFAGVDDDLTGHENLVLQGRLQGIGKRTAISRASELLEVMDLTDAADRNAGTYSGGMRRRLDLAAALVHTPPLIFLDEPTTGLDPQNRRALWEYLRKLNASGATIILTTQYLEEADELADRLSIIDQGKFVVEGTPEALKSELGGDRITVSLPSDTSPADLLLAVKTAERLGSKVSTEHNRVSLFVSDGGSRVAEVIREFDAAGISINNLEMAKPSLDDVFLKHTGSRLRDEASKTQSRGALIGGRKKRRA